MSKKEETKETKVEAAPEHPLWTKIKDLRVNMFALPNQVGGQFCDFVMAQDDVVYLRLKVPAFLPVLEEALGSEYKVEQTDLFILVSKKKA